MPAPVLSPAACSPLRLAALITGTCALACAPASVSVEIPPRTLPGDRVLVANTEGRVEARWLEDSAALPTFIVPADGALELTVVDLGATRAALGLSDVAPSLAPPARARRLARAPLIQRARLEGEVAGPWSRQAALDEPLSTLAAPYALDPCFALPMIERLPETSSAGAAFFAQDTDTTWLVSGSKWWALANGDRAPEPLASPVGPMVVRADARTADGALFLMGERRDVDGQTVELWLQRRGLGPFERVFAAPLAAFTDEPLALVATSTDVVVWLTRGSALVRLEWPAAGPPRRSELPLGADGPTRFGGLVARGRDDVVALLPYEIFGRPRRTIAEVRWGGATPEVKLSEVASELAFSLGVDADGGVWVGTATADALPLAVLLADPFEVPQAASIVTSIAPARNGPWRGVMLRGSGGLLRFRWRGLADDLRVDGYGDCAPGASGLNVRDALLVRGGAWIAAGSGASNETRVFWAPVPGLGP